MNAELKCVDKVQEQFESTMKDIMEAEKTEEGVSNFGLCFDYVEPYTFPKQREGYYRWQISYGGPSDEFRFFVDGDRDIKEIEYWFMDWFDGASIQVIGDDFDYLVEQWGFFIKDMGDNNTSY